MNSAKELERQELDILEQMKDLPLEMRLQLMREDMGLLRGATGDKKHAGGASAFQRKPKRTRGGIKELDAKQWVHRNKVGGAPNSQDRL